MVDIEIVMANGLNKRIFIQAKYFSNPAKALSQKERLDLKKKFSEIDIVLSITDSKSRMSDDLKTNSSFSILGFFIPSKRKEEILGDLMEIEMQLVKNGIPTWKIKIIMLLQIILVVYSFLRIRVRRTGIRKLE